MKVEHGNQEHLSKWLRAFHEIWQEEQRHKNTRFMADEQDDDFDLDMEDF